VELAGAERVEDEEILGALEQVRSGGSRDLHIAIRYERMQPLVSNVNRS
jgi:hypothetical protein